MFLKLSWISDEFNGSFRWSTPLVPWDWKESLGVRFDRNRWTLPSSHHGKADLSVKQPSLVGDLQSNHHKTSSDFSEEDWLRHGCCVSARPVEMQEFDDSKFDNGNFHHVVRRSSIRRGDLPKRRLRATQTMDSGTRSNDIYSLLSYTPTSIIGSCSSSSCFRFDWKCTQVITIKGNSIMIKVRLSLGLALPRHFDDHSTSS